MMTIERDPEALLKAGLASLESGDFASAVAAFTELTALRPRALVAWCGRSAAFYGANDFPRALAAAKRASELGPGDPRPFFVLAPPAFVLSDMAAIERCRVFIAGLDRERGREMASFWVKRLSDKDHFAEAADAFDLVASRCHDDAGVVFQRIDVLLNAFRVDDAAAALAQARAIGAPLHDIDALGARVHLARGDLKEASAASRRALSANPDLIVAYAILAETDPRAVGDAGETRLAALVGDEQLPAEKRIVGGMALGKSREKRGDIDRAFAAFAGAKALARKSLAAAGVRYDQRMMEADARRRAQVPAPRERESQPPQRVFIFGMPRSGSTLIDQVLSRHTAVASLGESLIVPKTAERFRQDAAAGVPYEDNLERSRPQFRAACGGDASVIVDKNLFNFQHCRLIADLDPSARFILSVRDPMDVGLSIFRTNFMAGHAWANDFDDIAHMIAYCEFLTDHWRRVFGEAMFVARHENFVADFERNVRALLAFCGLPFEPACLAFHEAARPVFTQSAAQVRRPLNAEGVERWRAYEKHLEGFRRSLEKHRSAFGATA